MHLSRQQSTGSRRRVHHRYQRTSLAGTSIGFSNKNETHETQSMTGKYRRLTWVTIAVFAHLIVVLLHGRAHTSLDVGLSNWQQLYVLAVIVLAPLVAFVLSLTRYVRAGLWL